MFWSAILQHPLAKGPYFANSSTLDMTSSFVATVNSRFYELRIFLKKERCQEIKLHRHNTVISATTVLLYCCLKMREAENESRGEKKEKWGIFTRIKDRLSSTPNKSEINNAVAECITLHRCRTPKGPRAERLFRGSSAKMGYIWQLNQGREKEKERDRIRESGKKGKHCQMNDIRLPFIPALLPLTL